MHLLPILAALSTALAAPTPEVPGGELDGYRLVFSDEFAGDQLDAKAWACRTGPRLWSDNLPRNVSVADGRLKIALKKEPSSGLNYTAGGIISRETFGYGYYEARFRVPPGAGWHTSFWLMRFDGGAARRAGDPVQEIDICEQDSVNLHRYAPNLHRWLPEPHVSRGHRNIDVEPDLSAEYHTWGCLWLPQRLTYYFDGRPVHSIDATAYPHGPHNIWLTTVAAALGGTKAVDDSQLPAAAEFDYVRHWVPAEPSPKAALNLADKLRPSPLSARFVDPDYYIWCGAPIKGDDGRYHLYYSRWPRRLGHHAWVTHSEIAHAVAKTALGPYEHRDVALAPRGKEFWDGLCTHNPTVLRVGGRYYLYYMGNTGDGKALPQLNWTHRNQQRIGVAVADTPDGPWQRLDKPLIDVTPGFHDALCCANPSVTQRPDGGFLMVYKAVADQGKPPFGGPVVHVVALSDSPTGPFVKQPKPVFTTGDVAFAAEDPFIWFGPDRYWAVVKDMGGHFTAAGKSLALFESANGLDWKLAEHPLVSKVQVTRPDGSVQPLNSLERPQLLFEGGVPTALYCAVDETGQREHSYNIHIPLGP